MSQHLRDEGFAMDVKRYPAVDTMHGAIPIHQTSSPSWLAGTNEHDMVSPPVERMTVLQRDFPKADTNQKPVRQDWRSRPRRHPGLQNHQDRWPAALAQEWVAVEADGYVAAR
jgi:hypothetical protein